MYVYVAALHELAQYYTDQKRFSKAVDVHHKLLSLLNENPEENKHTIAEG